MARKILLADDSVTAQNMGRKILADAGYDVITVNNGSAALKRISELRPDLIVLDVYMPGYSGLEVCQRLKESADTAHIPVLLTVGKLEPFKPEEARRVRADAHIVKPFEASELLTAISKLEDRMVPQSGDSPRIGGSTAGVERFGSEQGGKKSSAKVPETDTGWKNRIRFPSKKKKEEEPDAEELAAAEMATLADSRKGKKAAGSGVFAKTPATREPAVVPDIPRDITPEELDALSALAEKLDAPVVAQNTAPTEGRKFQRRSTDFPAAQVAAPPTSTPVAAVGEKNETNVASTGAPEEKLVEEKPVAGIRVGENAAVAEKRAPEAVAEVPAFEVQAEAVEAATIVAVEAAEGLKEQEGERTREVVQQPAIEAASSDSSNLDQANSVAANIEAASVDAPNTDVAKIDAAKIDAASPEAAVSAPSSSVEASEALSEQSQSVSSEQPAIEEAPAAASVPFQVVTPINENQPEVISTVASAEDRITESGSETFPAASVETQPVDGPAPSDAELAAALQLLTPATSSADSQPSNGNHPTEYSGSGNQVAAEASRWVAESVPLSAEESAICLESEMFGIPSVRAQAAAAGAAMVDHTNPVSTIEFERSFGFSGIAAAVETRLAEAGMGASARTWTMDRERSAESAASEAAAALEASAELLAAASAAHPLMDEIGANVEQNIRGSLETGNPAVHADTTHESSSRDESSATFADAMSPDNHNNYEVAATAVSGENDSTVSVNHDQAVHEASNSIEAEGQDSMNKDRDKKTQSGKSNWHEVTAPVAGSGNDVEKAKQTASGEDSQKAMAAAASDSANSSTDANTIASIVDSVMADLRPRIVEEIARKLAKK